MGLSSSIVQPGRRDIETSRWPPILQNASLPLLCAYYTAFTELPSAMVSLRQLAHAVGLTGDELQDISRIWGGALNINVWELLISLVLTSRVLSLRTKLAFVFRLCDEDRSDRLEVPEMTAMFITCLRGLGAYLRWSSDSQLTLQATREFVQKSFCVDTSEKEFVDWVLKQPVLLATLQAFTAKRMQAKDSLDFELKSSSGTNHAAQNSLIAHVRAEAEETASRRRRVALVGLPPIQGPAATTKAPNVSHSGPAPHGKCQAGSNGHNSTCCELPPIDQPSARSHHPSSTKKTSHSSLLDGQLGWCRNPPQCLDESYRCPLHGHAKSKCILLTKHETWVSHMLWQDLKGYTGPIDAPGIKRLLRKSAKKLCGHGTQERYCGLARLTNPRENPLFAVCLGRMRAGAVVPIRDFLQALCPCANHEQIDCLENLDLRSWREEQQFVEAVGQWSCDSSDFWRKPVMRPKSHKALVAQFEAMDVNGDSHLSVSEICTAEFSPDDAKDLVSRHDLDGNGSINLFEFVHMQCPDAKRPRGNVDFERALRSHWDNVLESWEVGRCADPMTSPRVAQKLFVSADSNGDGSISLDEIAGYVDVHTSRDLMAAYDSNSDGRLSHSEFHSMIGATAAA